VHTVRAILGNPRYTGRQVWNRQRTDRGLVNGIEVEYDTVGSPTDPALLLARYRSPPDWWCAE
jgi:hypothetical protein